MTALVMSPSLERYTLADVEERVLDLVSDLLRIPVERLELTARLQDLGTDSADIVELQLHLLETYEVEFDLAKRAQSLECIGDLIRLVHETVNAEAS